MPIKRWYGWCAVCKKCGNQVELNSSGEFYKVKQDIKNVLKKEYSYKITLEERITEACGCED